MSELTLADVARRLDVAPATLRSWVAKGVVPLRDGEWTAAAIAHARLVARLRARGHSLAELRTAAAEGRLAYGHLERLVREGAPRHSLADAAHATGLEPDLIERIWRQLGLPDPRDHGFTDAELELLRRAAAVLEAGLPRVAFLQLIRVYGQAIAQIADAEARLFHLYVHEPLMRAGVPGLEIAERMEDLAAGLLPNAAPMMDGLHRQLLRHYIQQDVVGHMEMEADVEEGRMRVALAFADLAGYTRLTEEAGEERAFDVVERFIETIEASLPADARVIKTIGDGAMVVGTDPCALAEWAVAFQAGRERARPRPRIGLHVGAALYRDGDYYGRDVNLAARVAARAAAGEVLVTDAIVAAEPGNLAFDRIGDVKLKGFAEPTELYLARERA